MNRTSGQKEDERERVAASDIEGKRTLFEHIFFSQRSRKLVYVSSEDILPLRDRQT